MRETAAFITLCIGANVTASKLQQSKRDGITWFWKQCLVVVEYDVGLKQQTDVYTHAYAHAYIIDHAN